MKITIPQGTLNIGPVAAVPQEPVVLVAGGRAPTLAWLTELARIYPVWAIDRGADVCQAAGLNPQILLGDADSATGEAWQWLTGLATPVLRYPADKDDSDLQLALRELTRQRPGSAALLTGGWGGRFDHAWSNVSSLIQAMDQGLGPAALIDQAETMFLLSGGQQLTFEFVHVPKIISLIPLAPTCEQVFSSGVHWPLNGARLSLHEPAAISNRLAKDSQQIMVGLQSGILGVYCCWQETGL